MNSVSIFNIFISGVLFGEFIVYAFQKPKKMTTKAFLKKFRFLLVIAFLNLVVGVLWS